MVYKPRATQGFRAIRDGRLVYGVGLRASRHGVFPDKFPDIFPIFSQ